MGMFDSLRCEMLLPETPVPCPNNDFQTKCTPDQYLTPYTITKDGRLSWRPYTMEEVPLGERPNSEFPFIGCVRRVERDAEFVDFQGDLFFYSIGDRGGWWEYKAHFVDGVCAAIEVVECSPPA